jgi:hypothetical protein
MSNLINDDDFDRMLDQVVSEHEDASATLLLAKEREERERQDFLSAFREIMQNVIRPACEQAAASPAIARAGRGDFEIHLKNHEARFTLTKKNNSRFQLAYNPDFHKKQVNLYSSINPDSGHRRKVAVLSLSEVTPDQVRAAVVVFLKEALSLA